MTPIGLLRQYTTEAMRRIFVIIYVSQCRMTSVRPSRALGVSAVRCRRAVGSAAVVRAVRITTETVVSGGRAESGGGTGTEGP